MSRLNEVIAIKLAGQPESLVGLSDLVSPYYYLVWAGTVEPCVIYVLWGQGWSTESHDQNLNREPVVPKIQGALQYL